MSCMFKSLAFLTFLFLLLPLQAFAWPARVVHVSDGDTIQVEPVDGGDRVKIRLYGIDTPEKKQPHGSIASSFTFENSLYKTVEVEVYDTDRYGRVVAVVLLPEGANLNEELIKQGHAWVYDRYCKEAFCSDWKQLEQEAKENKEGLWFSRSPVPPWDWRKWK